MRAPLLLLLALVAARGAPALETARELAGAGAPQLALARVEQLQPRAPQAPRWAEWEALRLELLAELGRNEEALARAQALPGDLPQPWLRRSLLAAARAALAAGHGEQARVYAARLIWRLAPEPGELRAARLLVIESHLAQRQGEAALRAMLRFQQDYAPLERPTAERFVEGLLALGMEGQAVNWLASLEEASALKLLLRLKSGLVGAEEALAQARAQLARGGEAGHWRVIAEAARRRGELPLLVEALERMLAAQATGAGAPELWETYLAAAQEAANRAQLLVGEEPAWSDYAARRLADNPPLARALFAHLARRGAAPATRRGAELQLIVSLHQSGLELAALRLFAERDPETMDPQARYLLGGIAEARNAPSAAVRLWQGLAAPPAGNEEEWRVRLASVQWRAGMTQAAAATLALLPRGAPLPPQAHSRARALLEEMLVSGRADLAEELAAVLLAAAAGEEGRAILYALGKTAEAAARHAQAADYYLRAALAAGAPRSDAFASQARLAAALNLARAGYREDARVQFEWVLKHSKDSAQLEIARRALSGL